MARQRAAICRAHLLGVILVSLVVKPITYHCVSFFVLVKSSNFAQDSVGELALLNYHFFSEVFLLPEGSLESGFFSERGRTPLCQRT